MTEHTLNRELSPFELVFWRLAQAGSLNVTTIAAVDGPLGEVELRAGLQLLQRRHPLLQVRICTADGPVRFVSRQVPDVPLRIVGTAASDLETLVEAEINEPIDPARGPLARCTWIQHGGESQHLLLTFHHAIGDGMSGVLLMRDLLITVAAALRGDSGRAPPPLLDSRPMDLRLPATARGARGVWNQIRFVAGMVADDLRLRAPVRPRADQEAPLSARRTQLICRQVSASTLDQLARAARAQQTTIHGALSAAVVLATVQDNSANAAMSVKHRSPVNMRQLLDPAVADDVGMFASMTFYRGRVKATDDFWSLARDIRSSIKHQIDRGVPAVLVGMLPRLDRLLRGDRLPVEEFGAGWQHRTPSTTGLTNLGRVALEGAFEPLEVRSLHFAVSPGGLGDCATTAATYNGTLRWNFLYAAPLFTADRAGRITDDAVARLEQAITE